MRCVCDRFEEREIVANGLTYNRENVAAPGGLLDGRATAAPRAPRGQGTPRRFSSREPAVLVTMPSLGLYHPLAMPAERVQRLAQSGGE